MNDLNDNPLKHYDIPIDTLAGRLFVPKSAKPVPSALVIGGSEGAFGWSNAMGTALATHGILAMAVSYFDWNGQFALPDQIVEIPLDPFAQAIEILRSEQSTDSDELAVIGYSRGAEMALLLATLYPEITRVVAYAPSSLVWRGFPVSKPAPKSSWCYQGRPIPFATFTDGYFDQAGWQGDAVITQASIPVEKIAGPLLLISGADDEVWPSSKMAEMVMARLHAHEHPYPSRHLKLEGIGHDLGAPNFAKTLSTNPADNDPIWLAWQAVIDFLDEPTK